jgi:hypothetical protein
MNRQINLVINGQGGLAAPFSFRKRTIIPYEQSTGVRI